MQKCFFDCINPRKSIIETKVALYSRMTRLRLQVRVYFCVPFMYAGTQYGKTTTLGDNSMHSAATDAKANGVQTKAPGRSLLYARYANETLIYLNKLNHTCKKKRFKLLKLFKF